MRSFSHFIPSMGVQVDMYIVNAMKTKLKLVELLIHSNHILIAHTTFFFSFFLFKPPLRTGNVISTICLLLTNK